MSRLRRMVMRYESSCPPRVEQRKIEYSEIRMEAICDESLWIWYVFFGCPGSFNDVTILNCSPLFAEVLAGNFPPSAPSIKIEVFDLKRY
jgi:Plant transposon protein